MSKADVLRASLPILLAVQERELERQAKERAAASCAAAGTSLVGDAVVGSQRGDFDKAVGE